MAKCGECGLVAMEDGKTGNPCEVPLSTRTHGVALPQIDNSPICTGLVIDLRLELPEMLPNNAATRTLDILNKVRQCSKYQPWRQSFSPKEHLQMLYDNEAKVVQSNKDRRERWEDRLWMIFSNMLFLIVGAYLKTKL